MNVGDRVRAKTDLTGNVPWREDQTYANGGPDAVVAACEMSAEERQQEKEIEKYTKMSQMKFQWIKSDPCTCGEHEGKRTKYILSIGRFLFGIVETKSDTTWGAKIAIGDSIITEMSGGPLTRDEYMKWVEDEILQCTQSFFDVLKCESGKRIIKESLYRRSENGELKQNILEET